MKTGKRHNVPDHQGVMISSTYSDLVEHRKAVIDALVRLGFFPIGMEFDSAKAGKDVIDSSLEMVTKAQAYVGIVSHRYGGVPADTKRNPRKLSITELEYREALNRGIPVYMFLMSDEHPVKPAGFEMVDAYRKNLQALKDDARSRYIYAEFSSVEELKSLVLQSIFELKEQLTESDRGAKSAKGERRGKKGPEIPSPPRLFAVPNFVSGHEFVGLAQLRGELALQRGDAYLAMTAFERVIEMIHVVGAPVEVFEARLALAKALAGDSEQAREICDRLSELAEPPHVGLASAYLNIGELDKARYHALKGYSWAWAEGPPYSLWRELEQCRAVLSAVGEPEPNLPAFDPKTVEPLPFEQEIRKLIADSKKEKEEKNKPS